MSADSWFRRLLRLIPHDFRADYGDEMAQVFRDQRRESAGIGGAVRVWIETMGAIMSIGPREHFAQLSQDVRYALRGMRRQPGFVTVAVLTLALAIGANTAIFSIVHAVLLAPLPYAAPQRLLHVSNRWEGRTDVALSDPEYLDYAERTGTLDIAALTNGTANLSDGTGDPERVQAAVVTANTFAVLGVAPAVGRGLEPRDGVRGAARVVIISDALWRRRYGADLSLVGRSISMNGQPVDVVGIMAAGFRLPAEFHGPAVDVIVPLSLNAAAPRDRRGGHYLLGVARLRDHATVQAAQADMDAVITRLIAEYPEEHDQGPNFRVDLQPLRDVLLGDARPVVLVLTGAVGLVLLIACANVANLLLARGESRRRELAVRAALGASRLRVARQLVTESCVLSFAGAVAGLAVAMWLQRIVVVIDPAALPRLADVEFSTPVLLFTAGIAVLTGIVFGLVPALQISKVRVNDALKDGARGGTEGTRTAARRALVVSQVAVAVILLVAGGLLLKSFARLVSVPSGLDPAGVLTMRVSLPPSRYPALPEVSAFYSRLLERVRALPGVAVAGAGSGLPLAIASGDWGFDIEGRPKVNGRRPGAADWFVVTPGYFEAMGIRLADGRLPQPGDAAGATPVVLLNETSARKFFPNGDAIGKRVRMSASTGAEQPWRIVAGIVGDVRTRGLETPLRPEIYFPYEQFLHFAAGVQARSMTLTIRASGGDPLLLAAPVRAELRALDPEVAAADVREMEAVLSGSVAGRRLNAVLVGTFAVLALTLSIVGLYGVMAFHVVQRTREMGVRLALGASRREVLGLVVGQGMRLVAVGLIVGTAAALAVVSPMSSLLFEVSPRDAVVFSVAPLVLALAGLLASYVPALRATRVDPVIALRSE